MQVGSAGQGAPRLEAPGRWPAALFAGKVALLRLRRAIQDIRTGLPRLPQRWGGDADPVVAEGRSALWGDHRLGEHAHQLGKVHNLRRAAQALDGVAIPAGGTFSFWRQVGRASRGRGFVAGRMLQQGCMVSARGGGLCQLSNALYDAALQAGCAIVERHAHSRVVPGSATAVGRDATVAWNYVDLRFRPDRDLRLSVRLTADELVVRLHGTGGGAAPRPADADGPDLRAAARSCGTCAETRCFRHEAAPTVPAGRAVMLVDEAWPEFVAHIEGLRDGQAVLGVPLPGRLGRNAWPAAGARVASAPAAALARSLGTRMAQPGAARRRAEAAGADGIARSLGRLLAPEATRAWVAQSYLPYLWRDGQLGGRRFGVLMTRPPMAVLHARLDAAHAAHPDRATLADFRAAPELAGWEAEALAAAETVATPHAAIAALFPGRAVLLDWRTPDVPRVVRPGPGGRRIAFPGPVLARKGAYEVREAALALDLEVVLLGADLEGAGFWRGVRTLRPEPGARPYAWLEGVAAVVQPALVEEQPRRLLAACAAGVPVVATSACGLNGPGVTLVKPLDGACLTERLRALLGLVR